MTVNLVQQYEYSFKFFSGIFVDGSFVFSTDSGLLIIGLQPDLFRSTADYKVFRTLLPYTQDKPFEDKNFKQIRYQGPVVSQEHNLAVYPNSHNWHVIYLGSNSNIVFLEKNDEKWIEKLSDIPQKWFINLSKKPFFLKDQNYLNNLKIECRILDYCREKEKSLQIKNFVTTHILKPANKTEFYGIICCHVNNVLTFWSTTCGKSLLLKEFEFHNISIKYIKWFQITNELSWLLVFLTNGQVYVHEICDYPHVQNTFMLWSDEDFAFVKNIWVEKISNDQCLIFITKMSFVLVLLYSLTEKKVVSTIKEMIPKTTFIPGFTFVAEKKMLILVTDMGYFICMYFTIVQYEVTYTIKTINHNLNGEQTQNFTCTLVVFSKNLCTCVLIFESNMAKYSKNDGHVKNKLLFCTIPENLVELEKKILSINNFIYDDVIDCIETMRINRMNDNSNGSYQLDRKSLDKCSIQCIKLIYWKIAFKSKKTEQDECILQELQMLLHVYYLTSRFSNKKKILNDTEQYFYQVMLSYYLNKLPIEYAQIKKIAADSILSLKDVKHTYSCKTCERIILSFTDFRMFICDKEHKELRCPVTLKPLEMPCLVCSMCYTMAHVDTKNESCVWCFGKYIPNELLI